MGLPDDSGYFGRFGGRFVPETLQPALIELDEAVRRLGRDRSFRRDWLHHLREVAGRPTPLTYAGGLTKKWGGAHVYLKREDLNHTGAHKINNCLGQALLALRIGKKRVVAETGAGQHGVATATVCASLGISCTVYMGCADVERQKMNVDKMSLLGAEVRPVEGSSGTLKDAINEAIRDWITRVEDTHYMIGSVVGPHPYPFLVRSFQSVIGYETRRQFLAAREGVPDALVACVGGGSNAMGLFHPFVKRSGVRLIGVEALGAGGGDGLNAASLAFGTPGVLHGSYSYLLQDSWGQVLRTHSISAGLDYPAVGPEVSHLVKSGRMEVRTARDCEAVSAFME
ncbi:MAG: tryptophan synthase subunit beta, partial [Planctomycetota bacterium]